MKANKISVKSHLNRFLCQRGEEELLNKSFFENTFLFIEVDLKPSYFE